MLHSSVNPEMSNPEISKFANQNLWTKIPVEKKLNHHASM